MSKPAHLHHISSQTSLLPRLQGTVPLPPEMRAEVVRLLAELILEAAIRGKGVSGEVR